jgi:AP-1 complex subunit mu
VIPENENIMRSANLFYKKNECFMDVIEKLNMTVTSTGQVIKSEVLGKLQLKT